VNAGHWRTYQREYFLNLACISETAARICGLRRLLTLSYRDLPISGFYITIEANFQTYLSASKPLPGSRAGTVEVGCRILVADYSVLRG
jgi:hypothetical protein